MASGQTDRQIWSTEESPKAASHTHHGHAGELPLQVSGRRWSFPSMLLSKLDALSFLASYTKIKTIKVLKVLWDTWIHIFTFKDFLEDVRETNDKSDTLDFIKIELSLHERTKTSASLGEGMFSTPVST